MEDRLERRRKSHLEVGISLSYKENRDRNYIELRSRNKIDHYSKRRLMNFQPSSGQVSDLNLDTFEQVIDKKIRDQFPDILDKATSEEAAVQIILRHFGEAYHDGGEELLQSFVLTLKQLTSKSSILNKLTIEDMFAQGQTLNIIIDLLTHANTEIRHLASWVVTNLAAGSSSMTQSLMQAGIIDTMSRSFRFKDRKTTMNLIWALGNLAADSIQSRNRVNQSRIMDYVFDFWSNLTYFTTEDFDLFAWLLTNTVKGTPLPDQSVQDRNLQWYQENIDSLRDPQCASTALWGVSHLLENPFNAQRIFDIGLVQLAIDQVKCNSIASVASLKTISGIAFIDNPDITQQLHELEILDVLHQKLMFSQHRGVVKEILYIISNLLVANIQQTRTVVNHKIFSIAINKIHDPDFEIIREAYWVITQSSVTKAPDIIRTLLDCDILKHLISGLNQFNQQNIVIAILEAIDNILEVAKDYNQEILLYFDSAGGLTALEKVQRNRQRNVYEKAISVLQNHFETESEDLVHLDQQVTEKFIFS